MNCHVDISNIVLETERTILRPFYLTDLKDFNDYASIEGVGELAGWKHHKSLAESEKMLKSFIEDKKTFAIVLKENKKVIGSVGIERHGDYIDDETDKMFGRELGYVLSKEYWGLGIMPEVIDGILDYFFEDFGLDFFTCGHFLRNTQSKRVCEKAGFLFYKNIKIKMPDEKWEDIRTYIKFNENLNKDYT